VISLHDHHKDGPRFVDSVPDAVAACRRYFMAGGRLPCTIEHDGLIYTITLRYGWNLEKLP
jgi:hypothetical protein